MATNAAFTPGITEVDRNESAVLGLLADLPGLEPFVSGRAQPLVDMTEIAHTSAHFSESRRYSSSKMRCCKLCSDKSRDSMWRNRHLQSLLKLQRRSSFRCRCRQLLHLRPNRLLPPRTRRCFQSKYPGTPTMTESIPGPSLSPMSLA
jgi:hypothetical protein